MVTKAIIQNIDYTKNICRVRIPLFEIAARNIDVIEADAQFSVTPGVYNSYKTGDIVFISFEENRMELPVIIGKLFVSAADEFSDIRGSLSGNALVITETAQLPYSTTFNFDKITNNDKLYKNLNTPKKLADGIIELQQTKIQKYQTVIKVKDPANTENEYALYLKTSDDFSYSSNTSDASLNRLCTALKNSQTETIFVPLDMAVDKNGTVFPALLKVAEFNSESLILSIQINGNTYEIGRADIIEVHSIAIYY